MATYIGTAENVLDMLKGVVAFLTDTANFEPGKAWTLVSPASLASITGLDSGVILKGVGDGDDEVYVGMKFSTTVDGGSLKDVNLLLNGYAGYDAGLLWHEQPGAISLEKLPVIPLIDATHMTYWVSANPKRFIIMVELSTQYEGGYLGLMEPIAIENQYPYPLVIGGSYFAGESWATLNDDHSIFCSPGPSEFSSLAIRRPDGDWRYGIGDPLGNLSVWPTNVHPVDTLTVLDDTLTLENVILYPMMLHENKPVGMLGQLDGVFWIGNREDLSAKDTVIYEGVAYKIFANVGRRDRDSYFAIKWA